MAIRDNKGNYTDTARKVFDAADTIFKKIFAEYKDVLTLEEVMSLLNISVYDEYLNAVLGI